MINKKELQSPSVPTYRKNVTLAKAEELFNAIVKQLRKGNHYRSAHYTVDELARDLNTKRKNISSAILTCTGDNYKMLINKMRMRDVVRMMNDEKCQQMTIEDIALLAGYTSRQSFHVSFKRIFGCSPAAYRKTTTENDTLQIPSE